jgi:hypothetical protein
MTTDACAPHVVHLGIERAEDVRGFLRTQYGEDHYGAELRYFDWLYAQSPCRWFGGERAAGRLPVNAVLNTDGALAAIHAFVPFDLWSPWGGGIGIWDVEWINGSGIRGAGRALAAHLLDAVDVYAGYGCNELSVTAFQRMRLTIVPEIHRRVVVLDASRFRELLAEAGLAEQAEPCTLETPVLAARWRRLDAAALIPGEALEAYRARTKFGASRSAEWLAWRYDRHPLIAYATIAAAGGAAVLRVESVVGSDALVCRLLEFFPLRGAEAPLLNAVIAFAREAGAIGLDYFATSVRHADLISAAAHESGVTAIANPRLPYMFQPMEFGHANAPNMVLGIGGRAHHARADLSTFQAGKGDSNQDVLRTPSTIAKS